VLRQTFIGVAFILAACGTPRVSPPRLELLGFDGCPNTGELRSRLVEAVGDSQEVVYVDLTTLPPGDRRLRWGAPTILMGGNDLFEKNPGPTAALSCRMWPEGLPSVEELRHALQEHGEAP
jgi:hypothetical protein